MFAVISQNVRQLNIASPCGLFSQNVIHTCFHMIYKYVQFWTGRPFRITSCCWWPCLLDYLLIFFLQLSHIRGYVAQQSRFIPISNFTDHFVIKIVVILIVKPPIGAILIQLCKHSQNVMCVIIHFVGLEKKIWFLGFQSYDPKCKLPSYSATQRQTESCLCT